jgi:hypothetical protein|tara:strand:+ start:142 stop:510 length:369 start_codon:yes stop_codon:yes gene_type:complete
MAAELEDILDQVDCRHHKTRNLILGMILPLDDIVRRRGQNRRNARLSFIRRMAHVFDNMIDQGNDRLVDHEIRIEKMEQSINKLLSERRALQKALRAAKEADDKAQNGDEKCPEVAFGPKEA